MKRLPIILNNRNFEVEVVPELSGSIVSVTIYEVTRPKWKIFRCSYRCYKTFWITDYDTITEGVVSMVQKFLEDEAFKKGVILKWKQFEKTT